MADLAQSVAVAQADLNRAKSLAAKLGYELKQLLRERDQGTLVPGSFDYQVLAAEIELAASKSDAARAAVVNAQQTLTNTEKQGGFNEAADPAARNPADPVNSVSVNQIQTAATNPEVTVTPVDTVPTSQVKTDAGGVPVTTPISGNAAALVEEGGLAPQQALDVVFIQNNPVAPDPFAEENAPPEPLAQEIVVPGDYVVRPNNNGSFDVVENQTGTVVASGLDEAEANTFAQDQALRDEGVSVPNEADGPVFLNSFPPDAPSPYPNGLPYDDESGLLNPGWTLDEDNNPVFVGGGFVEPATQASADESRRIAAGVANAKKQQTLFNQQRQLNNLDWRVRLSLADNSNYLYNVASSGDNILDPLRPSNGVIFPYTPQIATNYKANYSPYDLTHSNYRGYFYQNSYTDNVTITATFTAQNTQEANYLLAVIHFFRSVTKMFYGQSQNLGSPPPMCFLTGLGDYQFNRHPVLVTNFSYNLPNDVDYIRAGSANNLQLNQNQLRNKQVQTTNNSLRSVSRLANALLPSGKSLPKGATATVPTLNTPNTQNPTYVPTKMDIVITLLPVQSRQRVSQVFDLQQFANGNQLKGGFW
jgi:hypothetical protein